MAVKSTEAMTEALSAIRRALNPDVETKKDSEEVIKQAVVEADKDEPIKGPDWTKRYHVVSSHLSSAKDCPSVSDFHLSKTCRKALKGMGINRLFPVQATVLPIVLGRERTPMGSRYDCDLCVAIPTGQGKTLGYLLPIFQLLSGRVYTTLRALVLAPTRDLALQVKEVADHFTNNTKDHFKVECVVGQYHAQTFAEQGSAGPDVMVATPSRALDLLTGERIPVDGIRWIVLDEADRLLNSSREATVEVVRRVKEASPRCQRMLFSATMTSNPQKLAQLALNRPFFLISTQTGAHATPENLRHRFIVARAEQKKPGVLLSLLQEIYPSEADEASSRTMLFCGSVEHAHRLARLLQICVEDDDRIVDNIIIREFSAALDQKHRVRMLEDFRTGKIHVLVCSDVAARGLDFREVDHVIQYDVPNNVQGYIHRCGRAGRAGRDGCSTTILVSKQVKHFKEMLREEDAVPLERLEQMKAVNDDIKDYQGKLSLLEVCLKREAKGVYSLTDRVDPVALRTGLMEALEEEDKVDKKKASGGKRRHGSSVYEELLSNVRQRIGGGGGVPNG